MMKTTLRAMVATVSQRGVLMRWWMQVARSDQLLKHEMQQKLVSAGGGMAQSLAAGPSYPGCDSCHSRNFYREKIVDAVENNLRH